MTVTELPGLDVVREALRRSAPRKVTRSAARGINRPAARIIAAFLVGALLIEGGEVVYDMFRPMTASQAVVVSAVVRVAAQQRKITEREMWGLLQREKGLRSPQLLSYQGAETLIYDVGATIDPLCAGLF